jgi:phosphocarrier protein HPr
MTVTRELIVTNKVGLHARPAATFAKTAAGYKSKITIENIDGGSKPVNAKSILSLLTIGVQKDHHIRLTIEGIDEVAAMDALAELVLNKCGEAE